MVTGLFGLGIRLFKLACFLPRLCFDLAGPGSHRLVGARRLSRSQGRTLHLLHLADGLVWITFGGGVDFHLASNGIHPAIRPALEGKAGPSLNQTRTGCHVGALMGTDFMIPLFQLMNLLFLFFRQLLAVTCLLITVYLASSCSRHIRTTGLTKIVNSAVSGGVVSK